MGKWKRMEENFIKKNSAEHNNEINQQTELIIIIRHLVAKFISI